MSEPWWELLQAQWDSTTCPVCSTEKWAKHPFCRSCSIRLQRANMMSKLQPLAGHAAAALARTRWGEDWMKEYDRARDYLVNRRRDPALTKAEPEEEAKQLSGPFPPIIGSCSFCGQSFPHPMPPGMMPKNVVDLQKYPDFDYSQYPGIHAACKHCWRPLNGAPEELIRA